MTDFLSKEETKYYIDFLFSLLLKIHDHSQMNPNEEFFTKFYKFPQIKYIFV